jgi:hypothetical protein
MLLCPEVCNVLEACNTAILVRLTVIMRFTALPTELLQRSQLIAHMEYDEFIYGLTTIQIRIVNL